ncbi:hybrid sensor histidine kinase/response regulator [Sedimentimonas flavescens]|uniref:hybrid sensor histidine kinase/response regulator n=1 Tax=Sedimentimonas flavescens TaxID=2851012 RepID=UPI0021A6E915|nr:PAS domain-containing hybrid sensor histidine kinase/response regulator [Sedimentimonas flavescens]
MQWSLSQVELEYYRYENNLLMAQENPEDSLDELRRSFDVFFSRIRIVKSGDAYSSIHDEPQIAEALNSVSTYLESAARLMDGDDQTLVAALPTLLSNARALHAQLRAISLRGIMVSAARSDQQREDISHTLLRLAAGTLFLIFALTALLLWLIHLTRLNARREQQLKRSSQQTEAIVATSLDAVIVANRCGQIIEFNGAAEQIFGYARAEAIGQPMQELIIPDDLRARHKGAMERYLRTGEKRFLGAGRIRLRAKRKSGAVFPVEVSVSSVLAGKDEIFVSYIRDITKSLEHEEALQRARDDALVGERAKTQFLAVMSHEMRTPLNGLLGTLELMDDTALTPQQRKYLDTMRVSGRLLLHHVNDVLQISRSDSGTETLSEAPFDIDTTVAEIVESQRALAHRNGNIIRTERIGALPRAVSGDERKLRQILLNLVGNAVKFTTDGTITIEIERVGQIRGAAMIEFRVIDSGIGIAEADLTRIFDDFVTLDTTYGRRAEGTGLGLGIARRYAEAMGGEIGVESEEGEGCAFWLRVPLTEVTKAAATEPAQEPVPRVAAKPLDILIVEDNEINRFVLRELLYKMGHRVDEAHNGRDGVDKAASRHYDVIFMDVSMPQMDGFEATHAIRSGNGPSHATRIVAVTAHALPTEVALFEAAGMNDWVIKPVSRQKLQTLFGAPPTATARKATGAAPRTLDHDALQELRDSLPAGSFAKLLRGFMEETDAAIAALPDRVSASETPEAVSLIHQTAGACGTFGAERLRKALSGIETRCKAGETVEIDGKLTPIWNETREALRPLLSRAQAAAGN